MENNLLKSLLLFFVITMLSSVKAEAAVRVAIQDGDWNDPSTWLLGAIPNNNNDIITIGYNVTLNGDRTISAGGSIIITSTGQLTLQHIVSSGNITIFGNGKLNFFQINNNVGSIINYGHLIGNNIANMVSGSITNKTSATLILANTLLNNGTFTNEVKALCNILILHNTGTFTNNGILRGEAINNSQGGQFINNRRIEIERLHNGENIGDSNNASGLFTNGLTGKIFLSDHAENYNGDLANQGVIVVENYFLNYDRLLIAPKGKLFVTEDFKNYTADGNGNEGKIRLYGLIHMGKRLFHLDAVPSSDGNKQFTNGGTIIGNGKGGIYAKEDDTFVENDGSISIGVNEVFLCIGTPGNYTNGGTGDFTQDCCFLLTADAGADQRFCRGSSTAPIGGSPTASMGTRPYGYTWSPNGNLSNATGSNGAANPPVERIYTVTVTDLDGCVATDAVTITPETINPLAHAGDDNHANPTCPGDLVILGGTPTATCGTGPYNFEWKRNTNPIAPAFSTDANPSVTPTKTTIYTLEITDLNGVTDTDQVTVFVNSDATANAGSDNTACGNSYTMQGILSTGQTGAWVITSGPGTLGDPSKPDMIVTGLSDGVNTTLKWTVTKGLCTSVDDVIIIGGSVTQAIVTTPNQTECVTTFPTAALAGILDGNLPTHAGETGKWVVISGNESQLTLDINTPFSDITFNQADTYELKWTIEKGGCTTESALKTITVKEKPIATVAIANEAVCGDASVVFTHTLDGSEPTGGATGTWKNLSGTLGTSLSDVNDRNAVLTVTDLVSFPTGISLEWVITKNGCDSDPAFKTVNINENPTANAGSDDTATGATYDMQADALILGETGLWTIVSQNEVAIAFDDLTNPQMQISNLTATSIVALTWTVTNTATSCITTSAQVTITGAACGVTQATVGEVNDTDCVSTLNFPHIFSLDGNMPTITEDGLWTIDSFTGNAATLDDDTNPTSDIRFSGEGEYDLTWTIDDGGGCSSTATKKIIIVKQEGRLLGAKACANTNDDVTVNMDASVLKGGAPGTWSVITKTNGDASTYLIQDPNSPTSNLNITNITSFPLELGLFWTVNQSGCISTLTYVVTVYENPTANPGSDDTASATTYNMQADALGGSETGLWNVISNNGATLGDLTDPQMEISDIVATSIVELTWTVTNTATSCSTTSAQVTIDGSACTVTQATVVAPIQTNCNQNFPYTILLDGNAHGGGETGTWVREASSTASATFTDATDPITLMEVLTPGILDLTWTISDGVSCTSTATKTYTVVQTEYTTGPLQSNCLDNSNNFLTAVNAVALFGGAPGVWSYSVTNGSADSYSFDNPINNAVNSFSITNITVAPLEFNLKWVANHDGCNSTYVVPIIINTLPTVNPGTATIICSDTFIMEGTLDATETGIWTQTGGTPVTMGVVTDPNMSITNLTTGEVITMLWTVKNSSTGCEDGAKVDITTQAVIAAVELPQEDICSTNGANELVELSAGVPALTGAQSGKWTYILTSGTADFSFSSGIDNAPNSQFSVANISVLPITVDLTWTVTEASECDLEYTKKITISDTPFANPGGAKNIDCINTSATIGTGTALAAHTYKWTTLDGNFVGVDDQIIVDVNQAGTYTLTVTNSAGCFNSNNVTVTNTGTLPVADVGADKTLDCSSPTVTIGTASAALANHTYKWTTLDGNFTGIDDQINVVVDQAGTYKLTVTSTATGCVSIPVEMTVTDGTTLPTVDAGSDQEINCTNPTVTIGTGTAQAGYSYQWTTTGTGNIVGATNNITATADQAGTYTLKVTIDATTCSDTRTVDVTSDIALPIVDAGNDQEINCTNPTATIGTGLPLAGHSYLWTTTTGNIVGAANGITATADQAGTYTLKVTNDVTTCFATQSIDVTADIALPSADAGNDQEINCTNPTVTIGTGTAQVGYSYLWTTTGTGNIVGATNNITATVDQAGTYILKVTIDATSCFATDDVLVTEDVALPIANAGLDIFLCNDLDVTLNATKPALSTGLWEVLFGGGADIVSPTDPKTEVTGLNPNSTVTLKWTEDNGCGTDSKTITITTNDAPTVSNAGSNQTLCEGTTTATLDGNAPISGAGRWDVVSGPAILSDEFFTNSTVSGLTDGSTSVLKWTITNGTCPISESEVIIKVLEPKAIEKSEFQICDGESAQLLAAGGISYAWSPAEGLDAVDIPNPIATPSIPTTYTVIINGGGTCGSTTKEVKVDVIANPIVTITEDATINIGESIDLLATGGTGYSWTPAEGLDNASIANPVATPTKNTTYNVTVSNIEGCSAEASVTIEVKEDFEIFVPQMFEPNSNTNNIVKVNTIGVKNVVFKIYNRSNKEIFSTTDGSIGWDGKYNGTVQNMDTYVYVVIAETYAGTKITRQGSIQLVR